MFTSYSVDRPNKATTRDEMAKNDTATEILEATRQCLLDDGYAALSTRKVAEEASVPLSQIHYHFGSKDELILSLLRAENDRLLQRQATMFSSDLPLSEQWEIACDYLAQDLESGYVRVLQEMMAAGWSSERVGKEVHQMLDGWTGVLHEAALRTEAAGVSLGGFTPGEVVALISSVFLGAEAQILLGRESDDLPLQEALRKVGRLMSRSETRRPDEG
jgi:AcrR family transcriptional regulator